MDTSAETNELGAALAQAQGVFPEIERTRTVRVKLKSGGGYDYDYAPLDSIIAQVKPILAENGLSFRWSPHVVYENGHAIVTQTCRLQHQSGQWTDTTIALRTEETAPQAIGSALTYGRRYTLEHALGLAAQTDDDGSAAAGSEAVAQPRAPREQNYQPRPACPQCGSTTAVIAGKPEYGGGWVCFKKKEGCGHTWRDAPAETKPGDPGTFAKALKAVAGIVDHPTADKIAEHVEQRRAEGKLTDAEATHLQEMIVAKQKLIETEAQQAIEEGATA